MLKKSIGYLLIFILLFSLSAFIVSADKPGSCIKGVTFTYCGGKSETSECYCDDNCKAYGDCCGGDSNGYGSYEQMCKLGSVSSGTCPSSLGDCNKDIPGANGCVKPCGTPAVDYYCFAIGSNWQWRTFDQSAQACSSLGDKCKTFTYPQSCTAVKGGNPLTNTGKCYAISGGSNKNQPAWRYDTEEICTDGVVTQQGGCLAAGKSPPQPAQCSTLPQGTDTNCPSSLGACNKDIPEANGCVKQCGPSGINYYCVNIKNPNGNDNWAWITRPNDGQLASGCNTVNDKCKTFEFPSACTAVKGGNPLTNTGKCYSISGGSNKNQPIWRYDTEEVCADGTVAQQASGGCASAGKGSKTQCDSACPGPAYLGNCGEGTTECKKTCGGTDYYCFAIGGSNYQWRTFAESAQACSSLGDKCKTFTYPSSCTSAVKGGNPLTNTGKCYAISGGAGQDQPAWRYDTEEVCADGTIVPKQQANGNPGGCVAFGRSKAECSTTQIGYTSGVSGGITKQQVTNWIDAHCS